MREFEREREVVCELARTAGRGILRRYGDSVAVQYKGPHATQPVTVADTEANTLIVAGLRRAFPDDAILAEESADSAHRLAVPRLWCVDPLDGTKDFIERTDFFSVMIGLAVKGQPALGVVYEPVGERLIWGCSGEAWCEDAGGTQRLHVSAVSDMGAATMTVSRAHPSRTVAHIAASLGIQKMLPLGSVGLKIARIAMGIADLYISLSDRTQEWDACAPHAIICAAGGSMTDTLGEPLQYNKPTPNTPQGLVASNTRLHTAALAAIAAQRSLP